jgi:hypothetical protein
MNTDINKDQLEQEVTEGLSSFLICANVGLLIV